MSELVEVQQDLRFVREVIEQRGVGRPPGTATIYYIWAVYTLVSYCLIDLDPHWARRFQSVGLVAALALTAWISRRAVKRSGEWDVAARQRRMLHWLAAPILAVVATIALCFVIPPLRQGTYAGQLSVVLIGMIYFLAGVHFDRLFLGLGLVLMAGGVCVGLVPNFGWTILGIVIACGLAVPTFFPSWRRGA